MKVSFLKWAVIASAVFSATASAYDTTIIEMNNIDSVVELDATVEAVNRGTLSAQTSGRIVAVNAM